MTHLKRKQAIAEFGRRFATRQDYTEFVEHLLVDNSASFGGTVFPPWWFFGAATMGVSLYF